MREQTVRPRYGWSLLAALILSVAMSNVDAQAAVATQEVRSAQRFTSSSLKRPVTLARMKVRLEEALRAISEQAGISLSYSRRIVPVDRPVTLQVENVPAREALEEVLRGTDLGLYVSPSGQVALVHRIAPPEVEVGSEPPAGTIAGRVTDAGSGAGIGGASVLLEGTRFGAVTDNAGRYRIEGVPAGTHTLVVQQLGYAEARQAVTVTESEEVTVTFALAVSALALDELVVTGSIIETRVRELPNPITVISSEDIERMNIQRVDQLFRGYVPGVISWANGSGLSGAGDYYYNEVIVRGTSRLSGQEFIKTYVDGVEMTLSQFSAHIDPSNIERVEILRGPQASTLYGPDATGGVMQIFTKKGRDTGLDRPRVDLSLSVGSVESEYGDGGTIQQDHSLYLSGGGSEFSYNLGGSYFRRGSFLIGDHVQRRAASAGIRANPGKVSVELSGRYTNAAFDVGDSPYSKDLAIRRGLPVPSIYPEEVWDLPTVELALNMTYTPIANWQHQLILGHSRFGVHYETAPTLATAADTLYTGLYDYEGFKRSIRYFSSLAFSVSDELSSTLTAGVDYWRYSYTAGYVQESQVATGTFYNTSYNARQGWQNTGYLLQNKLAIMETAFLTAGIRAEDNEAFGEDYGLALSPRIGASVVHGFGPVEAKFRAQWGESIRPPDPQYNYPKHTATSQHIPNPNLGPEQNLGWDAGMELYFGDRGHVEVTYYDQNAIDLISRETLQITPLVVTQYQNIGEVENRGWEFVGALNFAPFATRATFSINDSKVMELAPGYTGDLQPGDRSLRTPKYSGGLSLSYGFLEGSVSLDLTYLSSWIQVDYRALYDDFYELSGNPYRGSSRAYWIDYDPVTRLGLRVSQDLTEELNVFVDIDNLTDKQFGEVNNINIQPGRITMLGLRWVY